MLEMISVVSRGLLGGPATRDYPATVRPAFPGTRGHVEIDASKCILCGLCARQCPADALEIVRAEGRWTIDLFRCIACGACVPACPKQCLRMSEAYTPAAREKSSATVAADPPAPRPKNGPRAEAPQEQPIQS